jgi:intein/homing endonuclease
MGFMSVDQTLKIVLGTGYQIECIPAHLLWNGLKWMQAKDIKIGDELSIQYGQNKFGNGLSLNGFENSSHGNVSKKITERSLNEDFFYILGVIWIDGYFKTTISLKNPKTEEIVVALKKFGFKKYSYKAYKYNKLTEFSVYSLASKNFCLFLKFLGFHGKTSKEKLPIKILEFNKIQMRSFLQGLFEANGWTKPHTTTGAEIAFVSHNKFLVQDLQLILLSFGIVSCFKIHKHTRFNNPNGEQYYNLRINGYFSYVFFKEIGFRNPESQHKEALISDFIKEESGNIYPMDSKYIRNVYKRRIFQYPGRSSRRHIIKIANQYNDSYLKGIIKENLYYSKVISIE